MTPNEMKSLSALLAVARPDWHPQSITDSLRTITDRPLFDVMVASAKVAAVKANGTPAAIVANGPHWTSVSTPPVRPLAERAAELKAQRQAHRRAATLRRESRERAQRACTDCDEAGRLPGGLFCGHPSVVQR